MLQKFRNIQATSEASFNMGQISKIQSELSHFFIRIQFAVFTLY